MDQDTLVNEQIEAGRNFLALLDKYLPVTAAFWLKADEGGRWYLYVASEKVKRGDAGEAYREVRRAASEVNDPNFDQYRIKLIYQDHPLARAALATQRHNESRVPIRLTGSQFGGESAEDVYIYPPPCTAEGERWRGIAVMVYPEQEPQGAYYVEFWPRVPAAMVWPGGPPQRVARPAGVRVEGGRVLDFRPPEHPWPTLTRSDYEQKAVEAVQQLTAKGDSVREIAVSASHV